MPRSVVPLLALALAVTGCAEPKDDATLEEPAGCAPAGATAGDAALAEWALDDRNETSPTHGDALTPRCYLAQVSAWYMLDAT